MSPRRMAICAVAQKPVLRDNWRQRFQGMVWDLMEEVLAQTGLDFNEVDGIEGAITVSDDVFDARTISDNAMTDAVGAHYKSEEKVAQDGAQAIYYAMANILSGHHDLMVIAGHNKESQAQSRNMATHLAFEPFFTRPLGLDYQVAAGLQAQAYMNKSGVTDKQLAEVVARATAAAAKNKYQPEVKALSADEVLASPMLCDPIREAHAWPRSDGAVVMIVASEERAKSITDKPVFVTGVGNCYDGFFLGERDLASNFALKLAGERAYKMAGVSDPKKAFDLAELSDQYAYMNPMWAEGLGLCGDGEGAKWLADGGPEKMSVNLSGGTLAGAPIMLGGLYRVAEAVRQLRGEAGNLQKPGAKRALAHGVTGPAGQFHTAIVLEA